jgi:hypothetical protein
MHKPPITFGFREAMILALAAIAVATFVAISSL